MHSLTFTRLLLLAISHAAVSQIQAKPAWLTVASFNIENYLGTPAGDRPPKSDAARAAVRHSIHAIEPDIIALQEVGGLPALVELQSSLKRDGLDLPFSYLVHGWDTNIQVALLSRFPFERIKSLTNDTYLLGEKRLHVSRGFAEVTIRPRPNFAVTLFNAHLKSRRPSPTADEAELRAQEAIILHRFVEQELAADPGARIILLGDLNDDHDSQAVRTLIGRGKHALFDIRPSEKSDLPLPKQSAQPDRTTTWTHFFATQDVYSRIDYILISTSLLGAWSRQESYVLDLPSWGSASDHRPVVGRFALPE